MEKIDNKTFTKLFTHSDLFAGLSKTDLRTLSDGGEYLLFHQGSTIKSESPFAGHVYIIHEGDVVISRKGSSGEDVVLARFLSGECFGELDLFSTDGNPVTIRAEAETGLLVFPGADQSAENIFEEDPALGSKILRNLLSMVARRIRSTNHLISQRSPWVQELRKQVFIDKLTGLNNKTWLLEELPKELASRRTGSAVLVIKPDNFKVINDTYGHDAGDQTLSLLGGFVDNLAKGCGIPARHGGDVFAIIHNNANAKQITALANRIIRLIKTVDLTPITGATDLNLTVSVGITARGPGCTTPVPDIIQNAFDRMLTAREAGGDRTCNTGENDG